VNALAQPAGSIAGWFRQLPLHLLHEGVVGFLGKLHRARAIEKREANTTILGAGGGHFHTHVAIAGFCSTISHCVAIPDTALREIAP